MLHRFGSFELDETRFELRRNGKPLVVQRQVLETISFLVRNPDRLVSKDELIGGPWKGNAVSDAALAHVIMVARKTLADRGQKAPLIETVRGKGYRFLAQVTTTSASSGSSTSAATTAGDMGQAARADLIGRQEERQVLHGAAERAAAGHGSIVLIGGEPGIGKTSLLEHLSQGTSAMEVLWGHGWEGGGAPAFWPWLEIVRAYVDRHGEKAVPLMGSGAPDIAHWLPELRASLGLSAVSAADLDSPQARFRTFDSVTRFLTRAASLRPTLIIIDDLHAADDASVLLLQFMSRAVDAARLLVVATFRDLEVRSQSTLAGVLGGPLPHSTTMTLPGLSLPEVATLLGSRVGGLVSDDLARKVFEATNGNPFLVGEVARTIAAGGSYPRLKASRFGPFRFPERMVDIVRKHLRHLPGSTVSTLSIASVIGRDFDLPLLRELCGDDSDGSVGNLEPALVEGVVEESFKGAGVYSFSHALIRETLYHQLAPSRRSTLHLSAAELLERQQASDYAAVFQIAHHYYSAAAHGGAGKALEWSLKAARKARDLLAYEQAAEHYQRALHALDLQGRDETHACEILLLLADAHRLMGRAPESIATLQQAEAKARSVGEAQLVGKALLGCAEVLRDALVTDGTIQRRIDETLAMLPPEDSKLRAELLAVLSLASLLTKSLEERLELSAKAIAMARRLKDDDTLSAVLYYCSVTLSQSSQIDRAIDIGEEMIRLARQAHNVERLLDARLYRAGHLLAKGRRADVEIELREHARVTEEARHPLHTWWARVAACGKAMVAGKIATADAMAREAFGLGQPLLGLAAESGFGAQLVVIAVEKEGDERARDMERVVEVGSKMRKLVPGYLPWIPALAVAQFETGRVDEARVGLTELATAGFEKIPDDHHRLMVLSLAARLACALGDQERARGLYREVKLHAGMHVIAFLVGIYAGPASYFLGLLAACTNQPELAQSHFQAARDESDAIGSPSWRAWAEYELGVILAQRKRRLDVDQGVAMIRGSLGVARELGLARLERNAKAALRQR